MELLVDVLKVVCENVRYISLSSHLCVQFTAMIWFIMMGFGTAFILLHFDDRDNFSTGIATMHRVFWSGTLGESFDTTGTSRIQE